MMFQALTTRKKPLLRYIASYLYPLVLHGNDALNEAAISTSFGSWDKFFYDHVRCSFS